MPHQATLWTNVALLFATVNAQAQQVDFNHDVRPILSDKCFQCHGPDARTREADLRLDTQEGAFADLGGYSAFRPGDCDNSAALIRVFSDDPDEQMPPPDSKLVLTPAEKETLRKWVEQGASWDRHWAFVAPVKPTLPVVHRADWPLNEIDRFVLARLESEKLRPSSEAGRTQLIRRLTLDLTGLPPTWEETDAFLQDTSDNAYEKVVDRLLRSPAYGERMAWEWLDAARYADTDGFQGDPTRTMWPWRDWLIHALNENMPFDQFTIELLAGDLLPNATSDQVIATGFNRNHMYNGEGGRIAEETRIENVFDRAETTSTVWLGLTMTCARCHDHKFDPITQAEYYRLFAFFNRTSESGSRGGGKAPPTVEYRTPEQQAELKNVDARIAALNEQLSAPMPDVDRAQAVWESETKNRLKDVVPNVTKVDESVGGLPPEIVEALLVDGDRRDATQRQLLQRYYREQHSESWKTLHAEVTKLTDQREQLQKSSTTVMVMDELPADHRRKTLILIRGTYNKPGDEVHAGTPAFLPPLPGNAPRNRLTLARWLVDPANPLTARVTVNRYWQTFFGNGLVGTSEDFGRQGSQPTHPELLDWLATRFIESGWDTKAMHKLIVMSATYRQSSQAPAPLSSGGDGVEARSYHHDPANQFLSRAPRYRLPSWMLRDQALAVSGLLVERVGGPPIKPYQPAGIWAEATFGKIRYTPDTGANLYRRSLYVFWRRIVGPTMFFDGAKRQTCEVKPTRTNTPLHALTTLNETTFVEAARAMAQRIMQPPDQSLDQRIAAAFRLATARQPKSEELDLLMARWQKLNVHFAAHPDQARQLISVGNSPRDETLNEAEHAAHAVVCSLILNLDETLSRE